MFSKDYLLEGMRNQIRKERSMSIRPVISRGRQIENNVDWDAMNVRSIELVDPVTGKFYFTVGYSIVGGDDVVRP